MEKINRKNHWDNIYQSKTIQEVSWYQPKPETSLQFIRELKLPLTAKIIDIGGGDSFLVDCLLDLGYENITVLDISATAIERAKQRLDALRGMRTHARTIADVTIIPLQVAIS